MNNGKLLAITAFIILFTLALSIGISTVVAYHAVGFFIDITWAQAFWGAVIFNFIVMAINGRK